MSLVGAIIGFSIPTCIVSFKYTFNGLSNGITFGTLASVAAEGVQCLFTNHCEISKAFTSGVVLGGLIGTSMGMAIGLSKAPKVIPICVAAMLIGAVAAEPHVEDEMNLQYAGLINQNDFLDI